jgi:hypothetical protein
MSLPVTKPMDDGSTQCGILTVMPATGHIQQQRSISVRDDTAAKITRII